MTPIRQQRGATLIVSLIILILMTLLAISAFNIGKGNLQIVGNMQRMNDVLSAAEGAVEEATSTTRLFESPQAIFSNGSNTKSVDVNGDGVADVTVTLTPTPTCTKVATLLNSQLDLSNSEDAGCSVGVAQNFGMAGAASGKSMCADSLWEVNAQAADNQTNAKVVVTQGVMVRTSTDNTASSCP